VVIGLSAAAAVLSLTIVNTPTPNLAEAAPPPETAALPTEAISTLANLQLGATPLMATPVEWFRFRYATTPPRPHHHKVKPHKARTHTAKTYTVRHGDSFSSIAKKFHVNWMNLAADNKMHLYTPLKVGEVLHLPKPGEKAHAAMPVHDPAASVAVTNARSSSVTSTSAATVTPAAPTGGMSSFEQCVISRESGGNPEVTNGSGHWGLFQFSEATWIAYGGSPSAFGNASAAVQEQVFDNAMARGGESNWAPYDGC
jgi:LysM repeat protein